MKWLCVGLVILAHLVVLPSLAFSNQWSSPNASLFVPGVTSTASPVSTGWIVNSGSPLLILASGTASYGDLGLPWGLTGPSGTVPPSIHAPVPSAPFNSLLARIGGGPWFFVGENFFEQTSIGEGGELFLAINDTYHGDNQGSYYVQLWFDGVPNGAAVPSVPGPAAEGRVRVVPNPLSPTTSAATVHYSVAKEGPVQVRIFNVEGAMVRSLYNGSRTPGDYEIAWDGRDEHGNQVAAGAYYSQVNTGGTADARKVLVVR